MRPILCSFALALLPAVAQAHWIWVYPDAADATKGHIVFAHELTPDENPKILERLSGMKLWVRTSDGEKEVTATREPNLYTFPLSAPRLTIGGINDYGVVQKGNAKAFRLVQIPKLVLGNDVRPWSRLPLEMVPRVDGKTVRIAVLYQGKPAPKGLKVTVHPFDDKESPTLTTDDKGEAEFTAEKAGLIGFSVPHTVTEAGELDGKKYEETRYSASLVVPVGQAASADAKGDPAAIQLFEQARMARAHWANFPGFEADVEVQVDGKSARGRVEVTAACKVKLSGLPEDLEQDARRELTSIVGHRKDTSKDPTPAVVFDEKAGASPLGKAIRVVGDEFESGYRIRDNQLVVVQRAMPKVRFVIVLLKNATNAEGKYLPESHVVQYFDSESGKLLKSDANFHTWTRVGAFDLPATSTKVTSTESSTADHVGPRTIRLTLTNHRLAAAGAVGGR